MEWPPLTVLMAAPCLHAIDDEDRLAVADSKNSPPVRDRILETTVAVVFGDNHASLHVRNQHPRHGMTRPEEEASHFGAVASVDEHCGVESGATEGLSQTRPREIATHTGIHDEGLASEREVEAESVSMCVRRESEVSVRTVVEDRAAPTRAQDRETTVRKSNAFRRIGRMRTSESGGSVMTKEPPRSRIEAVRHTGRFCVTQTCGDGRSNTARIPEIRAVQYECSPIVRVAVRGRRLIVTELCP